MFDKFKQADTQGEASQEEAREKVAAAAEEATHQQKDGFSARFSEGVKNKTSKLTDSVKDFSFGEKAIDFARSSVQLVQNLDKDLALNHAAYEVGTFRVNATAGLHAGMTLDIQFVKTQTARAETNDMLKHIIVNSPKTGKPIKIPKANLEGRTQAKIKDPDTGDILVIDVKTGKALVNTQSTQEEENESQKYLVVNSPKTGKPIKIPKANLEGRTQAKIKDPDTGDDLVIDVKTGKILVNTQSAQAKPNEIPTYFIVNSPKTGKPIKISKASLVGRAQVKIKDPDTGEVLVLDAKTGKLLPQGA